MKNAPNIETIDKDRHAKLRVMPNPDFVHAKDTNLIAITLGELSACTNNYPVVFILTPNNTFHPVALMGLRPGENVYYGAEAWASTYVPRMIQCPPFVIALDDRKTEEEVVLTACIDRSSAFVSETEGVALFTPAGEQTDYLNLVSRMLGEVFESQKVTTQFTAKMEELGLLAPFELLLQPMNAEPRKVSGMFSLNERKLRELTNEQVLELHKLDFLPVCYLILSSLFQFPRLIHLRNKQLEEQIVDYRTEIVEPAKAQEAANAAG